MAAGGGRLEPVSASPGSALGVFYHTTHGTQPTLGSILWRYGTVAESLERHGCALAVAMPEGRYEMPEGRYGALAVAVPEGRYEI